MSKNFSTRHMLDYLRLCAFNWISKEKENVSSKRSGISTKVYIPVIWGGSQTDQMPLVASISLLPSKKPQQSSVAEKVYTKASSLALVMSFSMGNSSEAL